MLKNRCLSRAISQSGWREFRCLCENKSHKFGRHFVAISRWEPTSQVCCECGYKWGKLDLSVREIVCFNCGKLHDRDDNASKRIEQVGVGHIHDSKRTGRKPKTEISAASNELSTHLEYSVDQRGQPFDEPVPGRTRAQGAFPNGDHMPAEITESVFIAQVAGTVPVNFRCPPGTA